MKVGWSRKMKTNEGWLVESDSVHRAKTTQFRIYGFEDESQYMNSTPPSHPIVQPYLVVKTDISKQEFPTGVPTDRLGSRAVLSSLFPILVPALGGVQYPEAFMYGPGIAWRKKQRRSCHTHDKRCRLTL